MERERKKICSIKKVVEREGEKNREKRSIYIRLFKQLDILPTLIRILQNIYHCLCVSSSILNNVDSDVQSNILFQCCVCIRVFLCVLDCIHKCLAALSGVIIVRTCGNIKEKYKEKG